MSCAVLRLRDLRWSLLEVEEICGWIRLGAPCQTVWFHPVSRRIYVLRLLMNTTPPDRSGVALQAAGARLNPKLFTRLETAREEEKLPCCVVLWLCVCVRAHIPKSKLKP